MLDDLFTYRLGPDRFLTVTNASNHEKDLAWFQQHAAGHDVKVEDRLHDYAMLAVQGPDARALVEQLARRRAAEAVPDRHAHASPGAENVLVAGTGYTGEDGVELLLAPAARDHGLGRADRQAAPRPSASAPATPSASRSASTSTATTCPRTAARSRPASAGAARRTRASSAPRPSATPAPNGTAEQLAPVRPHRPRHRPPGQPRRRRRRGDERDAVAVPEPGHRHGVPADGKDRARHGVRDRRSRQARGPPRSARSRSTARRASGRGVLSVGPQVPPGARLGPHRWRHRHARDHVVRPGAARRGRVLRPAGRRRPRSRRTSPTPRSSP